MLHDLQDIEYFYNMKNGCWQYLRTFFKKKFISYMFKKNLQENFTIISLKKSGFMIY